MKELNISIYFFFSPITQWCSISDVLFSSGRGVSDFSVLKCQSCSKYYVIKYKYKYNKCKYQYQYMKSKYKYRRSK